MRKYLHINLDDRSARTEELHGQALAEAGRFFIAKTLLAANAATVDPLSPANPMIFSAGPFAGTNFSNANRISVGCKSPLTGGIKEANAGGTFALALGHLEIAGFTLHGASGDWVVIHIPKDGPVTFESAEPYLGRGNFEAAEMLHARYGAKVSVALCGPVGEYQGLVAGIAFSDAQNRPTRFAARGGVGAVMGSKKVKAIVVEKYKLSSLHDRRKVIDAVKVYGRKIDESPAVEALKTYGTATVADLTNTVGGLPVRNFRVGQLVAPGNGPLKLGGDFIRKQNIDRGGDPEHACMPGCLIKCSNIYADSQGSELVSPLEYETIGLLGSNCGLTESDDVAELNAIANDLGIDTIETGAMLAVLMEAGQAEFGDMTFLKEALEDIGAGNERGRLLAQGTVRVGAHFKVARVPVIKKQAISAYDPRVIEVTGVSMMVTAQGADHTTGNLPAYKCDDKTISDLVAASYDAQVNAAVADSIGLCVFGRSVTDNNLELIANAINDAHAIEIDPAFLLNMGRETLRIERAFNLLAGFTNADDELPTFFYQESLAPTDKVARLHGDEVNGYMREIEERIGL